MQARSSSRSFVQAALLVAAVGGIVVGLLAGMDATIRQWQAGGFHAPELAYLAAAAGSLLLIIAVFAARGNRKSIPFATLIAGFAILGIAFNGLIGDFAGRMADFIVWGSGFSLGAAIGLFLAYWLIRRVKEH